MMDKQGCQIEDQVLRVRQAAVDGRPPGQWWIDAALALADEVERLRAPKVDMAELFGRCMAARDAGEPVRLTVAEHAQIKEMWPEVPDRGAMKLCYGVPCVIEGA